MKTRKQEHSDVSEAKHTPTPFEVTESGTEIEIQDANGTSIAVIIDGNKVKLAQQIVRAVNGFEALEAENRRLLTCHEELLEAAKTARNVLAGLVTGDLKEVRADSPALEALRNAIAKAEASSSTQGVR